MVKHFSKWSSMVVDNDGHEEKHAITEFSPLDTKIVSITRAFMNKLKKNLFHQDLSLLDIHFKWSSIWSSPHVVKQMVKHCLLDHLTNYAWPFAKMLDHCNGQAFSRYPYWYTWAQDDVVGKMVGVKSVVIFLTRD